MNEDIIKLLKKVASILNEFLKKYESEIESEENQNEHSLENENNRKVETHKERVEKFMNYIFSDNFVTRDLFTNEEEYEGILKVQKYYKFYINDFYPRRKGNQKIPDKEDHPELHKTHKDIDNGVKRNIYPYTEPCVKECWNVIWKDLKSMK